MHRSAIFLLCVSLSLVGKPVRALPLGGLTIDPPKPWRLFQRARSGGTSLLSFEHEGDVVTLYASEKSGLDLRSIFLNGSRVEQSESTERVGVIDWKILSTSKRTRWSGNDVNYFVHSFITTYGGVTYYGYARSRSREQSEQTARNFRLAFNEPLPQKTFSLTGSDYTGKKFYFGFGDLLTGMMGNEVRHDVKHTHDIFTKELGGNYIGTTQIGKEVDHDSIVHEWETIKKQVGSDDMYVQYSSGHGSTDGLMIGVDYDEIRDFALDLPAKEIIIFTMSCFSGNLVSSFDEKKEEWADWGKLGRTLFVMASARPHESSSVGPGRDPDEAGGPNGSAGSAFGHALWKALIGYSDGYLDGVKDGFISLGEIEAFSKMKTEEVGGHTPVVTGTYNPALIMNRVPRKEFAEALEREGEEASDVELERRLRGVLEQR